MGCGKCLSSSLIVLVVIYAIAVQLSIRAIPPPSVTERTELLNLISKDGAQAFVLPSGRVLEYFDCGEVQSSKAIVALHGAFTTGKSTCDLGSSSASALHIRIVSVSLPGWGLSSPSVRSNINDFAEDLRLLTQHLKIPEFGLMGTSMGGPVAVAMLGAQPSLPISSLLLLVPAAYLPQDGARDYGWFRYVLTVYVMPHLRMWDVMVTFLMAPLIRNAARPEELFRNTLSPAEVARCDNATLQVLGMDMQRSLKRYSNGASSMLLTLSHFNVTLELKVPPRTFIVSGVEDEIVPTNVGVLYERLLVGSTLIRAAGGHLSAGIEFAKYLPALFTE